MAVSRVNVYRLDYELEKASFTAYVMAFTTDEADAYLRSAVKNILQVKTREYVCRVDGMSNSVRKLIVDTSTTTGLEKKPSVEKTEVGETREQGKYVCPYCEKTYEKPQGLKMHLTKEHKKD